MANTTFLDLPVATSLDGTEVVPIVQPPNSSEGVSKRATVGQIAQLAGLYTYQLTAESVFGNTSTAVGVGTSIVGTAGQVFLYSDTGQIGFGQVNLGTAVAVTGILPVRLGGTGTSALDAFAVLLGNGTGALSEVAAATSGYVLTSNGTGSAPSYQLGGGLANQPGLSVLGVTGNATAAPAAITGSIDQVLRVDASGTALTFGQVNLSSTSAVTGFLNVSSYATGVLSVPHGGSGQSSLVANAVLLGNGTGVIGSATVVTAGWVLASTGTATPPAFAKLDISSSLVSGILTVPFGGTGTSALTAFGVLLGNGTSPVTIATAGSAGQILVGQTTTSQPQFVTATGDFTFSALGSGVIATNAVTFVKFQQMQGLSVHGNGSSATTNSTAIAGTADQVLVVNTGGTALAFGRVNIGTGAAVTGILAVPFGGTGTSALTAFGLVAGNGTAAAQIVTAGTAGQLLIAQTTTSLAVFTSATGDVLVGAAGTHTIVTAAVTFPKFQQFVPLSVHANASSATAISTAVAGTASQVLLINDGGTGLLFGQVNLSATAAVTGFLNVSSYATGTLPINRGGTGASVAATAIVNLGGLALATTGQAFSGGIVLTTLNLGTTANSTLTLVAGNNPTQRTLLNGTATIVAPSSDCEIDLLVTNSTSAGAISFSGYTGLTSTGDTYTTTNGSSYILMSRTINAISTYAWKIAK